MKTIRYISALALAAAVLAGTPASADTVTRTIRYNDLNLNNPAGVASLDARIRSAAYEMCGEPVSPSPRAQSEVRKCRTEAIASAQHSRGVAIASAQGQVQLASR